MNTNEKITAVILAGGTGERMGEDVPKQFLPLEGKPLIAHSVAAFEEHPLVSDIVIVCCESHMDMMKNIVDKSVSKKISKIIPGGDTRQESSFMGVNSSPEGTAYVLIHEAARPLLTTDVIDSVISSAKEIGAAGPVIDAEDTIIIQKDALIENIPERKNVKRVQTPQAFRHDLILKAHEWALENGVKDSTDDCGLVLAMGEEVGIARGEVSNIKITSKKDLAIAEEILKK